MFAKQELNKLTDTYSDAQIAKLNNVSRSYVQQIRSKLNVKSFREKTQTLTASKVDKLTDDYTDEQAAKQLGMSASGFRKARERFKVKAYAVKQSEIKTSNEIIELDELSNNYCNIEIAQIKGWTREYTNARFKQLKIKTFTDKTGKVKSSKGIITTFEHNATIHINAANKRRGKSQLISRKTFFNERYFAEIDSEDKAYFLGFIVSDGNLFRTTTQLSLTDPEPVFAFADCLGYPCEMIEFMPRRIPKHKDQWRIRLNSIAMANDLKKLGITPNKSFTIKYPSIAPELERHLIRGIWDGDGHVGYKQASVFGSQYCLLGIQFALQIRNLPTAEFISKRTGCYELRLLKSKPQTLLWIYSNCKYYLPRKYKIAQGWLR